MAETIDNDAFSRRRRRRIFFLIVGAAVLATIVGVALLMNIFERKQEARNPFYRVVELTDDTDDPAVWGKNFPLQYDDYKRTVDQVRTRYGGSEAVPRTPTKADPRSVVAQSKHRGGPAAEGDVGRLRVRQGFPRGARPRLHARRPDLHRAPAGGQAARHLHPLPRARSTCPTRRPGNGDLIKGFEKFNQMPYAEARKLVTHPVACIDCHDPSTMQLRVTRPGFIEGIARVQGQRRACRTTTSTRRRRARRCAPSSAASATSSTTSRGRRSGSSIRGPRGSRSKRSWPTTTRRSSRTGRTPTPARPCSRRSIRSSRCGTRASTRARA